MTGRKRQHRPAAGELHHLREDCNHEQDAARQSRAALHGQIDDLVNRIATMETTAVLSAEVDAQVRSEIGALKALVDGNTSSIAPTIEEWKRIRALGALHCRVARDRRVSVGAPPAMAAMPPSTPSAPAANLVVDPDALSVLGH
mgnify:CR=1 FL=1